VKVQHQSDEIKYNDMASNPDAPAFAV